MTIPHKQTIMKYLDECEPLAGEIGAVNTVMVRAGWVVVWMQYGLCRGAARAGEKNADSREPRFDFWRGGKRAGGGVCAGSRRRLGGDMRAAGKNGEGSWRERWAAKWWRGGRCGRKNLRRF